MAALCPPGQVANETAGYQEHHLSKVKEHLCAFCNMSERVLENCFASTGRCRLMLMLMDHDVVTVQDHLVLNVLAPLAILDLLDHLEMERCK